MILRFTQDLRDRHGRFGDLAMTDMITIQEITNKKTWEAFLTKKEIIYYPFFQSWEWGEVQRHMGFSIWRIGMSEGKTLVGVCQIIDIKARRGRYLHLRHGPVFLEWKKKYFDALLQYLTNYGKENNVGFIRISPFVQKDVFNNNLLEGWKNSPVHNMDAEVCWGLDITPSEEKLLMQMRKTHRQLIKKAQTLEIEVIKTTDPTALKDFLPLYKGLSQRKHFIPHKSVEEEFTVFGRENKEMLFLAKYQGKIISGAIIAFTEGMAIYRHGASDNNFRDIPASQLLQWEAIKEAKKRGATFYNFWGIAPDDSPNHPWKGLTLFKTGFGGQKLEFIHAHDLPLNLSYWKTFLIESFSTWQKGY